MAQGNKSLILILFLIIAASTVITPLWLPDITVIMLIYLALRFESTDILIWLIIGGLMHDAFQLNRVWISPLLFPLTFLGINFAKENFNTRFFPVRLAVTSFAILIIFLVYAIFFRISASLLITKGIGTLVLSAILSLLL